MGARTRFSGILQHNPIMPCHTIKHHLLISHVVMFPLAATSNRLSHGLVGLDPLGVRHPLRGGLQPRPQPHLVVTRRGGVPARVPLPRHFPRYRLQLRLRLCRRQDFRRLEGKFTYYGPARPCPIQKIQIIPFNPFHGLLTMYLLFAGASRPSRCLLAVLSRVRHRPRLRPRVCAGDEGSDSRRDGAKCPRRRGRWRRHPRPQRPQGRAQSVMTKKSKKSYCQYYLGVLNHSLHALKQV